MYLESVKNRYEELAKYFGTPIPCQESEVEEIEQRLGEALPAAYREFLLWMGKDGGGLLGSAQFYYPDVLELRDEAQEILQGSAATVALPDDAFVFCIQQSVLVHFMRLSEGANPPIYTYNEMDDTTVFSTTAASFSEFLATGLEDSADTIKELYGES